MDHYNNYKQTVNNSNNNTQNTHNTNHTQRRQDVSSRSNRMTNLFNDNTHVNNIKDNNSYTPTASMINHNHNRDSSIDAKMNAYNNPSTYNGVKQLKHGLN